MEWVDISSQVPKLKKLLVDGAHNKGGTQELRKYIDKLLKWNHLKSVTFVYGSSRKKVGIVK